MAVVFLLFVMAVVSCYWPWQLCFIIGHDSCVFVIGHAAAFCYRSWQLCFVIGHDSCVLLLVMIVVFCYWSWQLCFCYLSWQL